MVHVYYGDGKGKTTAVTGLAIRAAGAGWRVIFAQFLKGNFSSELRMMEKLGIKTMNEKSAPEFIWNMSDEQLEAERENEKQLFEDICRELDGEKTLSSGTGKLIVLDEVIHSINSGLLDGNMLYDFLDRYGRIYEIALTGGNPPDLLLKKADYVTCMNKVKHPFDKGIEGRKGIEY